MEYETWELVVITGMLLSAITIISGISAIYFKKTYSSVLLMLQLVVPITGLVLVLVGGLMSPAVSGG